MVDNRTQLSLEDKQMLKEIVLPWVDDLHRVALQLCHDHCNAEELVAECVARACEHFTKLRDHSKAKQWLLRILTNTYISKRRTERTRQEIPLSIDADISEDNFSLFDQLSMPFILWWSNPEREVINKLMDEDIRRAIGSLPDEYRVVIVLCDVEGFSYKEISGTLKIPIGTVRSRLARGRSFLQKSLWHYAEEPGIVQSRTKKGQREHVETHATP
ncbi:MAG: sigma-70 family RNA polymerase sigma factor [Ignavibacteriae bacterium]|nr:sigma-70 family RNA polymerase sigma factor [Ignavibacteriota bacterium]